MLIVIRMGISSLHISRNYVVFLLGLCSLSALAASSSPQSAACPCEKPELCLPIKNTTRKEVYAFARENDMARWLMYDWSKITTIAMDGYMNTSLMCLAHSYNARVVFIPDCDKLNFTDPSARQSWIQDQLHVVKKYYLDGLNFDFEGQIAEGDEARRNGYTDLVRETKETISKIFPYFQVSVDVTYRPDVWGRNYDMKGLANGSDFLFIMAYDEWSGLYAGPNCGFFNTFKGIQEYFSMGIGPDKLVVGLPWYGYIYPCLTEIKDICFLSHVPFRGANCSDAAGKQYGLSSIYSTIKSHGSAPKWNLDSLTPYYTYKDSNTTYQIQYDDDKSQKLKFDQASVYNLRGVGVFHVDCLDYTKTPEGKKMRDAMFGTLPSYK